MDLGRGVRLNGAVADYEYLQGVLNGRAGEERIVVAHVTESHVVAIYYTCGYTAKTIRGLQIRDDVLFAGIDARTGFGLAGHNLTEVEITQAARHPQRIIVDIAVIAGVVAVLDA